MQTTHQVIREESSTRTAIPKRSNLQLKEEDIEELVESMDVDGNERIDLDEFVMGIMEDKQLLTEAKLKAAFDYFDKDRSGAIDLGKAHQWTPLSLRFPAYTPLGFVCLELLWLL